MKKLFVLFAVAAMVVACNKPAEKVEDAVEAVETEVVEVVDSAAAVVDSAAAVVAPEVAPAN